MTGQSLLRHASILFGGWCLCVSALAQTESSERIIVEVGAQRMSEADGGSLRVDWVRSFESGVLSVGANRSAVGAGHWTLMSIGGARTYPAGWVLSGGVDFGPAKIYGDYSTFAKARAEISIPVSRGWTLSAQESFVDVHPVSGHLITGGARWVRDSGLSFNMQMSKSVAGDLDQRSMLFRLDRRAMPPYLMAGLVLGTSNNRLLLGVPDADAVETALREAFVGISFPFSRTELTFVTAVAQIGAARRASLSASFQRPVDWSR